MTTLTRKQREIRDREKLILGVARTMLVEQGYLGMTMDKIAEATEYSKGTIYQHFSCKEDVLAAIAIETSEKRTALFERASALRGGSRERMVAVGQAVDVFVRLYPHHFVSERLICTASIRGKTSDEKQQQLQMCDGKCMSIAAGIVRDAIAQGDLARPSVAPEELSFGLWALTFGTYTIQATDLPLTAIGIPSVSRALDAATAALMDGHGWRPLSSEHDYEQTRERIRREVFAAEIQALAATEGR